jgi:hypothetical protein
MLPLLLRTCMRSDRLATPWQLAVHSHQTSRDMNLKLGQAHLLSHHFQFITHCHPVIQYFVADSIAK